MTNMLDGSVIRMFGLTNEPGGLGLNCSSAGLFLAGVPLLRKTQAGFVPRPVSEIASLIKAAYGANGDPIRLQSSLGLIARALNSGDFALAAIAAVQTQTPELSLEAAARVANAEEKLSKQELAKYDPSEPRDWQGRWTTDGVVGSAATTAPPGEGAANQGTDPTNPRVSNSEQDGADRNALLTPASSTVSNDDGNVDQSQEPSALQQTFERKYDDLGPVDFAKQVIQFGDWLGRAGANLSPEEKQHALAEYSFLQDRLSFWQNYAYTPPTAQGNLLSAALTLYQGAINGGIVSVGNLPESMLALGGAASMFTDGAPRIRPATKPAFDDAPGTPPQAPKEIEGTGRIVDNSEANIVWGKGIKEQSGNWEDYIANENPDASKLRPGAPVFDHFNAETGEAISAKTLNTLTVNRIKKPQNIFNTLKRYVDNAVNYDRRLKSDVDPADIQSKTIHLAIPEYTSPAQWRQILRAIIYGKDNGVSIVITRIRG
jgi:hypothetical protein